MDDLIGRQAAIDEMWKIRRQQQMLDDTHKADMVTHGVYLAEKALKQLPSAQPEEIRINLNEPIKVKLTKWGKEIFYHQYDRINKIMDREVCKPKLPKEDENGYAKFQLWEFIELYGTHIGMTLPNVIEPLEIVYNAR